MQEKRWEQDAYQENGTEIFCQSAAELELLSSQGWRRYILYKLSVSPSCQQISHISWDVRGGKHQLHPSDVRKNYANVVDNESWI